MRQFLFLFLVSEISIFCALFDTCKFCITNLVLHEGHCVSTVYDTMPLKFVLKHGNKPSKCQPAVPFFFPFDCTFFKKKLRDALGIGLPLYVHTEVATMYSLLTPHFFNFPMLEVSLSLHHITSTRKGSSVWT